MRAAEFKQFALQRRYAGFHDNQRLWHFAPFCVRYGDHSHLIDSGMRQHRLFNFERGNVFSSAYDDVFLAVHNQQVAVFVHGGHVAGMEPSTAHGFSGSFRLFPVAVHYTVTAGHDLADALAVAWHIISIWIDHTNFYTRNSISCAGLAVVALLAFPLDP